VIFQAWAGTDIGKHRVVNEDCYLVDEETGLILVLDGMGGHVAGEVASHLAMETISAFYRRYSGSRRTALWSRNRLRISSCQAWELR
jgi:serine/threonine protein phosphatase PrpC